MYLVELKQDTQNNSITVKQTTPHQYSIVRGWKLKNL